MRHESMITYMIVLYDYVYHDDISCSFGSEIRIRNTDNSLTPPQFVHVTTTFLLTSGREVPMYCSTHCKRADASRNTHGLLKNCTLSQEKATASQRSTNNLPTPPAPPVDFIQVAAASTTPKQILSFLRERIVASSLLHLFDVLMYASNHHGSDMSARSAAPQGASTRHKRRFCKKDGCSRIVKSQGLCQGHGAKPKLCRVEGCTKQAQGNFDRMCSKCPAS